MDLLILDMQNLVINCSQPRKQAFVVQVPTLDKLESISADIDFLITTLDRAHFGSRDMLNQKLHFEGYYFVQITVPRNFGSDFCLQRFLHCSFPTCHPLDMI